MGSFLQDYVLPIHSYHQISTPGCIASDHTCIHIRYFCTRCFSNIHTLHQVCSINGKDFDIFTIVLLNVSIGSKICKTRSEALKVFSKVDSCLILIYSCSGPLLALLIKSCIYCWMAMEAGASKRAGTCLLNAPVCAMPTFVVSILLSRTTTSLKGTLPDLNGALAAFNSIILSCAIKDVKL